MPRFLVRSVSAVHLPQPTALALEEDGCGDGGVPHVRSLPTSRGRPQLRASPTLDPAVFEFDLEDDEAPPQSQRAKTRCQQPLTTLSTEPQRTPVKAPPQPELDATTVTPDRITCMSPPQLQQINAQTVAPFDSPDAEQGLLSPLFGNSHARLPLTTVAETPSPPRHLPQLTQAVEVAPSSPPAMPLVRSRSHLDNARALSLLLQGDDDAPMDITADESAGAQAGCNSLTHSPDELNSREAMSMDALPALEPLSATYPRTADQPAVPTTIAPLAAVVEVASSTEKLEMNRAADSVPADVPPPTTPIIAPRLAPRLMSASSTPLRKQFVTPTSSPFSSPARHASFNGSSVPVSSLSFLASPSHPPLVAASIAAASSPMRRAAPPSGGHLQSPSARFTSFVAQQAENYDAAAITSLSIGSLSTRAGRQRSAAKRRSVAPPSPARTPGRRPPPSPRLCDFFHAHDVALSALPKASRKRSRPSTSASDSSSSVLPSSKRVMADPAMDDAPPSVDVSTAPVKSTSALQRFVDHHQRALNELHQPDRLRAYAISLLHELQAVHAARLA